MRISRKIHQQITQQNVLFVFLFLAVIGLLAWIGDVYRFEADWTSSQRNSLSTSSQRLLETLDGPITITAFVSGNDELLRNISALVNRYTRFDSSIEFKIINPDTDPDLAQKMNISMDGELIIAYQNKTEKLQILNEQAISNALQRLARKGKRWIVFLDGHGERKANGQANADMGILSRELQRKGLTLESINLARTPSIPANTDVLIIASPQVDLLAGEAMLITKYVEAGGNLLWLMEPESLTGSGSLAGPKSLAGLEPLAELLGVDSLPGVIVDPATQLLGVNRVDYALATDYPRHGITKNLFTLSLFPRASALEVHSPEDWQAQVFIETSARTWTETGEISGDIRFGDDHDEQAGPLTIGLTLTRSLSNAMFESDSEETNHEKTNPGKTNQEQRIIIVGDGDFLSNQFLGNGGNLDLGLNMFNWISHDDELISINTRATPDATLNLGQTTQILIAIGFLILLPLSLFGSGIRIWLKRRRR
ncbi:MAG: GldG family protein [Gammaproteobacteria bacterium]|nr:GldG family protein [Gammaproteobacteria bacterium]